MHTVNCRGPESRLATILAAASEAVTADVVRRRTDHGRREQIATDVGRGTFMPGG
jgi:hypothetical protein